MSISLQAIVAISVIQALWGGNPVAVKFGLLVFPPLWSGFLRFAIAIVCILIWARISGIRMTPSRGEWKPLSWLAFFFFIQIWTMNYGFGLSSGAISSVLISTWPLFAAIFSHFMISDDRLSASRVVGLLTAFGGTSLIVLRGGGGEGDFSILGAWIILFSSFLLGFRLILSARLVRQMEPTKVVVWMMILPLWAFLGGGLAFEEVNLEALSWQPVAGILYQGVVIAGLGFMVNSLLMKRYSPTLISSFGFVSPVSGVLLSAWLLGEQLTWIIALGTACVGAGLVLIARPNKKPG